MKTNTVAVPSPATATAATSADGLAPPAARRASPSHSHSPLQSLRWALVGALLIGLVLPAVLASINNYLAIVTQAEQDLQRDLQRSADILTVTLSAPLWDVAPELAESQAKALIDDPRFASLIVRGQKMSHPFVDIQRLFGAIGESQKIERPILHDGEVIGSLTLTMIKRPYLDQLNDQLRREIWRTALTLAMSLILIFWVMQQRVFRPMDDLASAAESLAAGKLDRQLDVSGGDEIGRVGVAMERMRENLLAAFGSLRLYASTMEDKVAQRTSELSATNAELSTALEGLKAAQDNLIEAEKLASLGRLVAGVAHELNTPLGNAMTVVTTLEDRFVEMSARIIRGDGLRKSDLLALLDSTQQGHDLLRRNVEKAAELVRDFKQVAVDQSSEMRRRFDLGQVIEEILITVRPRFKHTPFTIETQLAEHIAMDSFPGPFGQVLTNLVLNALLHGLDGCSSGKVSVRSRLLADGRIEVVCEDDGIGMEDAVRKRIFDPFFTTKMGRGGSGLGLNIAHNIVTGLLGGRIEVSSWPGLGTRFVIVLPASAPTTNLAKASPAATTNRPAAAKTGEKVASA